jgi:aminoglycoside 3-N-acetyltransferase I
MDLDPEAAIPVKIPMPSSSPYSLKRLGPSDLSLMRALNAMFGRAFAEPDTYTGSPPGDAYLRDLLADQTFIALVACREGEVVGGLAAYELRKFEQERSEFYVYDLAVAEEHRRQGMATALLLEMKVIAKRRGGWVVMIQADHGDEPALALYTKLGVREEAVHFDIPVD